MGEFSGAAHSGAGKPFSLAALSILAAIACAVVVLGETEVQAQQVGIDRQAIVVSNGLANKDCILPGSNAMIQSTIAGDDTGGPIGTGNPINTGPDGICDTALGGDDVYVAGFVLGGGSPFQSVIVAGSPGDNNGVCDKIATAVGDDVVVAGPGKSTPRQVGVLPGVNAALNSTPAGDDLTTAVICAEPVGAFDSTPAGDDFIAAIDVRCQSAGCIASSCIVPGPNDLLETTVSPNDTARPYISTGADGIENTVLVADDQYDLPIYSLGGGTREATCVNSGTNGIAETDLCGTGGTLDVGEICDTGGESATCDSDCTLVSCGDGHTNGAAGEDCDTAGQSPTCDANCTFVACGDGTTNSAAGEECDDGNVLSNDGCNSTCQDEFCGDGITQGGLGETCDTSGESLTCDDDCTAPACGDGNTNETVGEECDDGNLLGNDGCTPTCDLEFCGDGIIQSGIGEQCDNGLLNSDTTPDACRTTCALPSCGDGVTDPSNTEQCDDGNNKSNDDCIVVLGCLNAVCGDGFTQTKGTPPFEECDDDNVVSGDGCDATCVIEPTPGCGNGLIDTVCTTGTVGDTCAVNADCDVSPGDGACTTEECDDDNNSNKDDCLNNCVDAECGDGIVKNRGTPPFEECDDDNLQPGDGCSATCVSECGNAQVDGACSQGTIGAFCQNNADCDVSPGDGVCVTEECDTGIDGLCLVTPPTCSDQCTIASCGNGVTECDEECDLETLNGVLGSGCTITCTRNVVGAKELTGKRECPAAWTLDSPPQDLRFQRQRCQDGAACDFDAVANGECVFSVGICLNRPQPGNCEQHPILAVDLTGLHTGIQFHADAAEALTDALKPLTSEIADAPGRCSEGETRKNCTVATDCDSYLGAGDGICNVATGVAYEGPLASPDVTYDPPLPIINQIAPCTTGTPIKVPVDTNLKLRLYVRRDGSVKGDKDTLRLVCEP